MPPASVPCACVHEGGGKWCGRNGHWSRGASFIACSHARLDVSRVPSSFLQAWITSGGRLEGVVTDRALIDVCLKGSTDWAGGHDGGAKDDIGGAGSKTLL